MSTDNHSKSVAELFEQCLIDFNYPEYSTLNEDEKLEVLSVGNFPILIKWLFGNIDDNYGKLLENLTNHELADVVCQHGFCTNHQKYEFIDGKLAATETLDILARMFNFLKDFKTVTPAGDDINTNIEIEEFLKDLKNNTNLFANEQHKFTQEQVRQKLDEYQNEINDLEKRIEHDQTANIDELPVENLNCVLEEIKSKLNMFKIKTADLLWQKVEGNTPFTSNYNNLGEECHSQLLKLQKLIQNIDLIFNTKTKYSNDNCKVNLELVKEKLVILGNTIKDLDNSTDN